MELLLRKWKASRKPMKKRNQDFGNAAFLEAAIKQAEKISDSYSKAVELEKRLNTVTDLYDVSEARTAKKISFERYLLIEYLEQILIAANERLKKLSNGQFVLIRSNRQESGGRQSGLGLDVYDAYTGQTRDVKTLSGGEKFNASLSLGPRHVRCDSKLSGRSIHRNDVY